MQYSMKNIRIYIKINVLHKNLCHLCMNLKVDLDFLLHERILGWDLLAKIFSPATIWPLLRSAMQLNYKQYIF